MQLRIVDRDAETFVVEVRNPSDDAARFDAVGLYFVPAYASDEPQRLGVVTAGQVTGPDGSWLDAPGAIDVAPHASMKVKLPAYCIDARREAPKEASKYHLASRRMPAALTTALAGAARTVASLGYDPEGVRGGRTTIAPHAATQTAIWRVRAAMQVSLVGETRRALE